MNSLGLAIAALAHDIHPDTALAIAEALEKNPQDNPMPALRGFLGSTVPNHLRAIEVMIDPGGIVNSHDVANMIRGAVGATVLKDREGIELVWTGPATGVVPIRRTEQVLTALIEASRRELFIVSFVAYDAAMVVNSIARASQRGVIVRILMERSQEQGGTLNFDAIEKLRGVLPLAEFYVWDGEIPNSGKLGSMHAKCAVADSDSAFITSANLTGAAMERNMELGVFVRGGNLPAQLSAHLSALRMIRTIRRI